MSYRSEKEEDAAFHSLNAEEKERYRENYHQSGGNVQDSLDSVLGPVWFNANGTTRGRWRLGKNMSKR